ncbi:hypothetical protein MATL_G00199810 [Megalops atlanticus]|uniref:Uncharacterized protein n=1 Tax=Megalops atlanticus TaxID=7932 RepID=A0A9D3PPV5_MEGAT|nr:hypothetical protein MATL_G00199810 [Megalops atlanticus]
MASPSTLFSEEQCHCSICLDVFTNPVSIPCGHNFCMSCIGGYWKSSAMYQCPMCKKTFYKRPDISINTVLREIAEQFRGMRDSTSEERVEPPSEETAEPRPEEPPGQPPPPPGDCVPCDVCTGEQLQAVRSCLVCLTSYCDEHIKTHNARFTKHKLIAPVRNLEDRMCKKHERLLELFCRSDQTCVCVLCIETDHRAHYTVPAERAWTEKKTQLKKTEAEVQQMMQDRQKKVEEIRQCVELSRSSTQREIDDSMQVFSALTFPSLCTPPHTRDWSDATVHTDVCVGTVRRAVSQLEETLREETNKLVEMVGVTLDALTANPWLQLSESGKQVRHAGTWQDLPDGPERFNTVVIVLGREPFDAGRHYWEVQVGEKDDWYVGVAKASVNRKGRIAVSTAHGYWALAMKKGQYRVSSAPPLLLTLHPRPRQVGVYLDYEEGQVSFYDVKARTHIHTFTDAFTEKLQPFFYLYCCDKASDSITISPFPETPPTKQC